MASLGSVEDYDFRSAYMLYKLAETAEERAAATLRLRAELERKSVSLDEALVREKAARSDEFQREVALLEELLRQDLKSMDTAAAAKKTVVEICVDMMEEDPKEAELYINVALSWATKAKTSPPDSCLGISLGDLARKKFKELTTHHASAPRAVVHIFKMTPQQHYRVSANVQRILKNKGNFVPMQDLSGAISASIKIEKDRASKIKLLKETAGWISSVTGVVTTALTTVEGVKSAQMNKDAVGEPLLNCRHFLPEGWYF